MTLYSLQWWFSLYCVLGAAAVLPLGLLAAFGRRGQTETVAVGGGHSAGHAH